MSPSIRDELEIDAHGTFSGSVVPQHPEDAGALSATLHTSERTLATQLEAMLETSAEVLICLIKAFD
jgi:hypothetical protein